MTSADRVRASTERTSDALLDLENAALARLDDTVQRVADAARQRIEQAAKTGRTALLRAELLPDQSWALGLMLPIVAELLAATREQAVTLVARQLGIVAPRVNGGHALADAGERAARDAAADVERDEYGRFGDEVSVAWARVEERAVEQRRLWWARHEEPPALLARVCSRERVALPGAGNRGAVWFLEAPVRAAARAASVSCSSRLLTAGMEGWNRGG